MDRLETYLGTHPYYAIISGFTSVLTAFIYIINPILQFMIGIGSFIIIILTIESKIKDIKNRKDEKGKK